jgi:ABC-type uncharacterized transport system permease subunit
MRKDYSIMKSSPGSYLLSLASAVAGAIVGALLVAVPFVLRTYPETGDRISFFLKWFLPFIAGFAVLYGAVDWVMRKKYLAIRRWTRGVIQSLF